MEIDSYWMCCQRKQKHRHLVSLPLNQFKASEGDGASKYRIALLSTRRNAGNNDKIVKKIANFTEHTVSMDDACGLWQGLHP